jgi:site-specific DNA-methyltransferase (adenine-specific)
MLRIELVQGDCLEKMKDIPDGSIGAVIADIPYGATACKWDTIIPLEPMWRQLIRITKKNGAIVLFGSQPFTSALVMSNPKMFRYSLVWQKTTPTGHLNAKRMPLRLHEDILVFGGTVYYPQKTFGNPRKVSTAAHKKNSRMTDNYGVHGLTTYDSTERYPTSVLTFKSDKQRSALHPTQKPVALMEYLIRTYTREGETVLDFAMGSGTTGVACKNAGRNFVGIELDPEYFGIAEKRIGKWGETNSYGIVDHSED